MNGQVLEQRRGFPIAATFCIAIATVLFVVSYLRHEPSWAIFAVLPGSIGLTLLIGLGSPFSADLTEQEIVLHSSNSIIPFKEIQHLWMKNSRVNGPIYVFHERGVLKIPVLSSIRSADLYSHLRSWVPLEPPATDSRALNYHNTQIKVFGADKVWVYVQRPLFQSRENSAFRLVGLAMILTAVVWLIAGIALNLPGFFCGAIALFVIGLVVRYSLSSEMNKTLRKHRNSSLIISPVGIALSQGELVGELRWAEVRTAKLVFPTSSHRRRIQFQVEGASIDVLDLYNGPLDEIYARIVPYWNAG